ncbi:hypothetical protein ACT2FY_36635 [Paraburkholderia fungorum]
MPSFDIYPETKFFGTLVDQRRKQLDVEFFALIDKAGELHVRIEPVLEQALRSSLSTTILEERGKPSIYG